MGLRDGVRDGAAVGIEVGSTVGVDGYEVIVGVLVVGEIVGAEGATEGYEVDDNPVVTHVTPKSLLKYTRVDP